MEKKKVQKKVFYHFSNEPITWKDVKDFQFEDTDILQIGYVDAWENGTDNSGGDHYEAEVYRMVLETDEEFNKRVETAVKNKEWVKQKRYARYLELREEFENEE